MFLQERPRLPGIGRATAVVLLSVGISLPSGVRAEAEEGARLAFKYHCTTCHGQNGVASSDRYPNLAGQTTAYIASRLKYFREAVERGNQMNAQAAPLSDEDIEKLAAYFNSPN
jgi:cytochrome c553